MNSAALAQSAYSRMTRIAPSARDTEYRVFAQVTKDLGNFRPDDPAAFPRLAEALHSNQRLWSRLATDVADPGNGLSDQMRAQIFSLAEFTRTHSARVLRREAEPDILIDINTAMMRGLKGEPEAPQ